MQLRDKLFIGGRWVSSATDALLDVHSASTEQVIARVPAGAPADVDRAVAAARLALDGLVGDCARAAGRLPVPHP